uniref:FPL domain-containing protein n=1 Tax=Ditylenchus dipsaci TaxID=166011 RepID=A0A915EA78_9BILA
MNLIFGKKNQLWKSKNPHSLEYLRYLHGVLIKNEKVTESNKTLLIEALRAITEILIWGDQNDGSVFDFFLERQMLAHFLSIMKQRCGCYVNVQILQTLNILFENIRHETSLYFLLSNNHVDEIICHKFDFNNEEVLAYYISFLKTLSFKVNPHTIHFFYSESTDEFPLFTEALRFYNNGESMVRIAVRTLSLNIFKVKDDSMSKFVLNRSKDYFSFVSKGVAEQVIEMDVFARSAQNEASNRNTLLNMIDAHLDNMHYVNDILMIGNIELNALLLNGLFTYVFGPLYLASLADLRCHSTILLSKVSALFLLSQFVMVIHNKEAVQTLLTSLFFGDQSDVCSEWARSVEKGLHLVIRSPSEKVQERLFFYSHLKALNEGHDDHACFYALMLLFCISQNEACYNHVLTNSPRSVTSEILDAAQFPCTGKSSKCDTQLMENLIRIIENCSQPDTSIRPITIELACMVLRRLLIAIESDEFFHVAVEEAGRRSQTALLSYLRNLVFSENLFLEMFEDEYHQLSINEIRMSTISEDPGLYLPPSNTPLSGIPLAQRFHLVMMREFAGPCKTHLPLSSKLQPMAEMNDCINLNNSDLLSCTVINEKNERLSRFLVTDQFQLILVEPDNKKLGWAIVRFVGLLQDTAVTGDSSDSRALHVVVEDVKCRTKKGPSHR